MLILNVGHHMYTNVVTDANCNEIPEGIVDAVACVLIASHDLRGPYAKRNSRTGSIYVVKPRLHGPKEVWLIQCSAFSIAKHLRHPVIDNTAPGVLAAAKNCGA